MTDPRIHYSKHADAEQPSPKEHAIDCVVCNGTGFLYNNVTGEIQKHSTCRGRGWNYDPAIQITTLFDEDLKARERLDEEAKLFQEALEEND